MRSVKVLNGPISRRRRNTINPSEYDAVHSALMDKLILLVETRENFPHAESLFRVLFRFNLNRVGPPKYPREINWELIADYLNSRAPLYLTSVDH